MQNVFLERLQFMFLLQKRSQQIHQMQRMCMQVKASDAKIVSSKLQHFFFFWQQGKKIFFESVYKKPLLLNPFTFCLLAIRIIIFLLQSLFNMQGNAQVIGQRMFDIRASIKQFITSNNPIFNEKMKNIVNKDFTNIKDLAIFQHASDPTPNIFYYRAQKYDSDIHNDLQDYMIKEIDHFYNNHDQTFALAYIHSNFVDFIAFRHILQKWPQHFFLKLRRVYIVQASIAVRIIQTCSFGTFYRLCDELFLNVSDINQLKQHDRTLLKSLGEDPSVTAKPFKNSIKIIQNQIFGKKLDQYELHTGKYPVLILRLIARMISNPTELYVQGIFRKACDCQQLQKLEKQILKKNYQAIDDQPDIFVVCGLLKKILNNLKVPLFNYSIYQKIINYNGKEQLSFAIEVLKQMQYINQKVFTLMTVFLSKYIIAQKEFTKMPAYNLAVVFYPCLFRPEEYDIKDLINSSKFAKMLLIYFQKQNQIFEEGELKLAQAVLKQLNKGFIEL